MTTDDPQTSAGARGDASPPTGDGAARYADIMRAPRVVTIVSVGTALSMLAVNLFVLEDVSGLLLAATAGSAALALTSIRTLARFSPRAIARMQQLAEQLGGRFSPWRAGAGGNVGAPFDHGVEHQRLGVVTGALHGMPIEMGALSSQASSRYRAPGGRRHGYVTIQLPERLPNMIVSLGHLSRVFGVRIVPEQWHRSQRVDVGGRRRFRLSVAEGGEEIARTFFRPEIVALFERVGRDHDVEIRDRRLTLLALRSPAAGSERRWAERREALEALTAGLAGSDVWKTVGWQSRRLRGERLRADVSGSVATFFGVVAVVFVVLALAVLWSLGHIG